jgi:acyl-homoserine lactone acylase PvdQ
MGRNVVAVVVAVGLVVGSVVTGASAQTGPPEVPDHLRTFSIVPPGQEGTVTAEEFAAEDFGEHYDDQLEMYASLIDDDNVTDDELTKYYHSMQFAPGTAIESTYEPTEGVTVYRDELGIPHIFAETDEAASFALGYVSAEDRLFEMDILRHAARGTLTEYLGGDYLQMDIDTRREGYTEEEVLAMLDKLDDKFGTVGEQVQTGLQAYSDGINEYIGQLKTDPSFFSARPVEYEATGNPFPAFPVDWTPADTLFLVVLQIRVFGETAGREHINAGLYAHLTDKLGKKLGPKVFNDLLFQNDSRSPTTVPSDEGRFNSQNLGKVKKASYAIPDDAVEIAEDSARRETARTRLLASLGFTSPASNALLVSAEESATGNPLEIGAPQVGYAVPSFFMDVNVHTPNADFRGPAVPGASALIPLGRGADYAWSLTTGVSDAVDVRVEKLCEPDGASPTEESNAYLYKDECVEMEARDETFLVKPPPTDPGPPAMEERTFYRTRHGPVFARGAVKGAPVAFVKERFFWEKEIDSVPQFYRWNAEVDTLEDFKSAASKFTMSFNSFYADSANIGYFHVGFYPKRTKGVHPSLPIWGTGEWEWKGRFPFSKQPQIINPEQGWIANWNSKPALGWDSMDGFKWGPIQRVQLLNDAMHALLDGKGKAKLADLVNVIRDAATRDVRAVYLGPKMVKWARTGGDAGQVALDLVEEWIVKGAHRKNADRDDAMDDGAALAIFDAWWDVLVHRVFDDEIGEEGYELMDIPVSDYSPTGGSSFFHDFSVYLSNLFSKKTSGIYARNYCDDMTTADATESCKSKVGEALTAALANLTADQGADMNQWTTPAENLVFQELGAGAVAEIPWQNRGTHNHVVEILSDAK